MNVACKYAWILVVVSMLAPAAASPVWQVGTDNGNHNEFDHEAQADANFHLEGFVDYTSVAGLNGTGGDYSALPGEPLNGGDASQGMRRALTGGVNTNNIFFDLDFVEASAVEYQLRLDYSGSGGGGGHDLALYWNADGTAPTAPFATLAGQSGSGEANLVINPAAVGAVEGANVLSIERAGGTGAWIGFDSLSLDYTPTGIYQAFDIGDHDGNQDEFEREGSPRNDPKFYHHAGDYTDVIGLDGAGELVGSPEPWINNGSATEGFPRALVPGRPDLDIFFQLSLKQGLYSSEMDFETNLISLGGGSSHDLAFFINGAQFHSLTNVTGDTLVQTSIDPSLVAPGGNVLSIRRTGGGSSSPWIQFDYLTLGGAALSPVPEPATLVIWALGVLALACYGRRRR